MRPILLLSLLVLSACASVPFDSPPLDSRALSAMAIESSEVSFSDGALFGVTSSGSQVADLEPCNVVLTRSAISFITWNRNGMHQFKKELSIPLSRIESAALVHYGNLGHLRQIHLASELGKVVVSFGLGESGRAERIFVHLTSAGVKVVPAGRYVRGANDGGFVPISMPSK